ncbi:MAG: SpoIVB peptidase S55 domain-containing protein [Actinomycetota bacterium]
MSVRRVRLSRSIPVTGVVALALVATLLAAGPAPAAVPCTSPPQTFPTSQMTRGMTGVGTTVLEGTTLETFNVEILGVMPNAIFLGVDIVVAKITGPANFLATTGGAIAGMSGSPISINGQLAGAVAWAIAGDRQIFGMTAAEDMVGMFTLPGGPTGSMPESVALTPQIRRAAEAAGSALEPGATLESLPIPIGVSGLNGMPLAKVERSFADRGIRVQAFRAGSVEAPSAVTLEPTPLAPGEGLGVALAYGDASLYGFGTATAVCGDTVIGFGHPMFWGIGPVSLGMNEVDVIAIDNNAFWGTKIGILGDARGSMTQDRFAGVAGVFGTLPTLVPITSTVSSPDTGLSREGETEVAWDEDFFVADAAFYHAWANLTFVAQQDGPGTLGLEWTISGTREDGSPFTVSNRLMAYSTYSATSEAWQLANALYTLAFNGFENIEFTGVDMTGEVTGENLTSQIERIRVSSPLQRSLKERSVLRAEPGDRVTIEVTLKPIDRDTKVVSVLTFRVPRGARGSEEIRISGGRGRLNFGRGINSLDDLIAALNGGDHANDLIVNGFGQTVTQVQDVIVRGRGGFTIQVVR